MNELALFAGAGGGILASKLLGWRTVCAVEWEAYPASVLCARQNDGLLPPFPIWDDVQTFDGKPWRGIVDVVSGGFPCQDISAAGRGAGIDGERSGMWGEMARIIREVRPRYVFVENSPMLTSRGLGRVLGDLASMGFDARWGVLGAADVGAKHQRDRIWIVAEHLGNANNNGQAAAKISTSIAQRSNHGEARSEQASEFERSSEQYAELADTRCQPERSDQRLQPQSKVSIRKNSSILCSEVSNPTSIRPQGQGQHEQPIYSAQGGDWETDYVESIGSSEQWSVEPNVGRVADGVAARVDRLKAIGNGQVPLCAATAWRILTER
jgi:DNA (cytosine-5)-methyltransferase 1